MCIYMFSRTCEQFDMCTPYKRSKDGCYWQQRSAVQQTPACAQRQVHNNTSVWITSYHTSAVHIARLDGRQE